MRHVARGHETAISQNRHVPNVSEQPQRTRKPTQDTRRKNDEQPMTFNITETRCSPYRARPQAHYALGTGKSPSAELARQQKASTPLGTRASLLMRTENTRPLPSTCPGIDGGSVPAAVVRHGRVEIDPACEAVALQRAEEPHDAADVQPKGICVVARVSSGGTVLFPQARQHVLRGLLVSAKHCGV